MTYLNGIEPSWEKNHDFVSEKDQTTELYSLFPQILK